MVKRRKLVRAEAPKVRRPPGRPRGPGSETEMTRVAKARAKLALGGKTPKELLLEWGASGRMVYTAINGRRERSFMLEPGQRIDAIKAAARYYDTSASAATEQVVRLVIDEAALKVIAAQKPEVLPVLREVLSMIGAGGPAMAAAAGMGRGADPARTTATLRPDSPTQGRA